MTPNPKFLNQSNEFWATVKLLSQELGYSNKHGITVPSLNEIKTLFIELEFDVTTIEVNSNITEFGKLLLDYFQYRADILNNNVRAYLMDVEEAADIFANMTANYKPKCPIPKNKQKGEKASIAFYTAIINILIERSLGALACNYDPRQITAFTRNNLPAKSLSRRLDGCFPSEINPIAIWEIKEYYYTTTFGSRIADGVYESMLDGYELLNAREVIGRNVFHYLMIDSNRTWWGMGKAYLCRIIDMMHMGLITECIFGKEAIQRIPEIVPLWHNLYEQHKADYPDLPQMALPLD